MRRRVVDLSQEDVRVLGLAAGIEIDADELPSLTNVLNAIRDGVAAIDPAELEGAEPMPVVWPGRQR